MDCLSGGLIERNNNKLEKCICRDALVEFLELKLHEQMSIVVLFPESGKFNMNAAIFEMESAHSILSRRLLA